MTIVKWIGIAFITLLLLFVLLISLMNWSWVRDIAAQQISDMTDRKFTINGEINLLRAPCTYPRGKTAGYYGAENRKRRATLTSKTQTIILPVARPRGIAS